MALEQHQSPAPAAPARTPLTLLDLVEQLSRFEGPPDLFLRSLLAFQCRIAAAGAGAILRSVPAPPASAPGSGQGQPAGSAEVLAVFPPMPAPTASAPPPVWLSQAAESAPAVAAGGKTAIVPLRRASDLYGQPAGQHLMLLPLHSGASVRGVQAFFFDTAEPTILGRAQERLELTVALLSLYEMRLTLQARGEDLRRLQRAMEVLSAVNDCHNFRGAAMAACNQVASRWNAHRVSLGVLRGRYVHLQALSHTEKFTRKMRLVQDIESAMEECLDQDVEILYPPPDGAPYISRAAAELSTRQGPSALVCMPLRRMGKVAGVLAVERSPDQPFNLGEIELLRVTSDLIAPRLIDRFETDRWFGARWAAQSKEALATLVGPTHTWAKATAAGIFIALVFLTFFKGADRVRADFDVQPTERRILSAPFDGILHEVEVDPGQTVVGGQTVLARLDTTELELSLHQAQLEQSQARQEADIALRDGKMPDREIALRRADKSQPVIDQLQFRIDRATIRSPADGIVMQGDLKRQIGAPVKQGDTLFEVAPPQALLAELLVPEHRVSDVKVGQHGQLAATSHPGHYIGFTVERIDPVAEVRDTHNVFRVRVKLDEVPAWLRPGMEGVAKIDVGRRAFGYLWSRELVNWLRMKLWI
ncbi:MAG: HlyD family efflux transporter periplasmic adaptor subunit [Phycisphaeraceae bacterium]|nr:HlyD family efflux transporter periplasmic adaptor subunit [Phycisphaeraceae bacterium]